MYKLMNTMVGMAILCSTSEAVGQATTAPTAVSIVHMPQEREASDSERLIASVRKLPTHGLRDEEKIRAITLLKPWVGRMVAPGFQPNWESAAWKIASDRTLGDVFIGNYHTAGAAIRILDTASVLIVEFDLPHLDFPAEGQELASWRQAVKKYCQHGHEIIQCLKLAVWRTPDAIYYVPWAEQVTRKDLAPWRNHLTFKLSRGYFSVYAVKLINNDRPADSSFGIRTRLEDYADLVKSLKRDDLLKHIASANGHEWSVILRQWNVAEVAPAELCEHVVARKAMDPRELVQHMSLLQSRAPSADAVADLYDKLVELSNKGRLSDSMLLLIFGRLDRDGDRAAIRRSLGAIAGERLRRTATSQLDASPTTSRPDSP